MLKLTEEIGKGKERVCFQHPEDENKIVKVVYISSDKQMKRELDIYLQLAKKPDIKYEHIPQYYGAVKTDKGTGYIFDKIQNSDASISKPLHWHIQNGKSLDEFTVLLNELKSFLLKHEIVFCNDMSYEGNILVQKSSNGSSKLVVIDGLGDVVFIQLLNKINFLVRKKILRRWDKLIYRIQEFEDDFNS